MKNKVLLQAAKKGNLATVRRLLLADRAKTEGDLDEKWDLAFRIACQHSHDKIIHLLLKHGVFSGLLDDADGKTELIHACEKGNDKIVKLLLKEKDNYVLNFAGINSGQTALMVACQNGHDSTVELLLDFNADIHGVDNDGKNAFMFACQNGREKIVIQLIERKVNINGFDNENKTALMYACSGGYYNIVDILIKHDVHFDAWDKNSRRAVSYACESGNEQIVDLLLENLATLDFYDVHRKTVLMHSCERENYKMIELLLDYGAEINNVLTHSCFKTSIKLAKFLIKRAENVMESTDDWYPVLKNVCSNDGFFEILKLLIHHGVSLSTPADEFSAKTLLMHACEKGQTEIVELLLGQKPEEVNVNAVDKSGKSAFIYACESGHRNIVELMMNQKPEVVKMNEDMIAKDGKSALASACENNHSDVVLLLLKSGLVDVNELSGKTKKPALMYTCLKGHEDIAKQLLMHKADVNAQDLEYGNTALIHSCGISGKAYLRMVTCLLEHNVDINHSNNCGRTPLMFACMVGHVDIVRLLLERGANVNAISVEKETAFVYACLHGIVPTEFRQLTVIESEIRSYECEACAFEGIDGCGCYDSDDSENSNEGFGDRELGASPPKHVCDKGYETIVKLLVDHKANVNDGRGVNGNGRTALMYACIIGCDPIVSILLSQDNIEINARCMRNRTAFSYACHVGHECVVKLLLNASRAIDFDVCDEIYGRTALFLACEKRFESIVGLLMQHNVDVCKMDINGKTPLTYVWKKKLYTIACRLIRPGMDVSKLVNKKGKTILMIACENGFKETVSVLINSCVGVNIDFRDSLGKTALMYACEINDFEIVCLTLGLPDSNTINTDSSDIETKHSKVVDRKMKCDIGGVNTRHRKEMLKRSFDSMNNLTSSVKPGRKRMKGSSRKSKHKMSPVQKLGKTDRVNICDCNGQTALIIACKSNHLSGSKQVVNALIQCGADIHARDKRYITPLMYSCIAGNEDLVDILLEHGAGVHERDRAEKTVLIHACQAEMDNVRIVKRLIEADTDRYVNAQDLSGRTALIHSIENKNNKNKHSTVRLLLNHGANVNVQQRCESTALMVACEIGCFSVVSLLKRHGADIDVQDSVGRTALMYACQNGHNRIVKFLTNHGANVNLCNVNLKNALMLVCGGKSDDEEIVKQLVKHKADIHARDCNGETALMLACLQGHYSIVVLLQKNGAVVNEENSSGQTPLLLSCRANSENIVEFLLSCGPKTDDVNKDKDYIIIPFRCACIMGHDKIVELIIMKCDDLDLGKKDADNGKAPLMEACEHGMANIAEILVQHCVDVDAHDDKGMTALMYACSHGKEEVVKILLKYGANLNIRDNLGFTALIHACQRGWSKPAKILLSRGADVNSRDSRGQTAFTHCCPEWSGDIMSLLFKPKHDFREDSERHWVTRYLERHYEAYCHQACYFECVYLLIKYGLDVNTQARSGKTAIMWIVTQSGQVFASSNFSNDYSFDVLFIDNHLTNLLERNANLDIVDANGQTVFTYAMKGDEKTMKPLIDSGKLLGEDRTLKSVHKNALKKNKSRVSVSTSAIQVLMKNGIFEWDWWAPKMLITVGLEALKLGFCPPTIESTVDDNRSPLIRAAFNNDLTNVKYFLKNLYFLPEDYAILRTNEKLKARMKPSLQKTIRYFELTLEDWSYLHISKCISLAGPPTKRAERVDALPIPPLLRGKLKFEQCRCLP